jgi:hypothetical protein
MYPPVSKFGSASLSAEPFTLVSTSTEAPLHHPGIFCQANQSLRSIPGFIFLQQLTSLDT